MQKLEFIRKMNIMEQQWSIKTQDRVRDELDVIMNQLSRFALISNLSHFDGWIRNDANITKSGVSVYNDAKDTQKIGFVDGLMIPNSGLCEDIVRYISERDCNSFIKIVNECIDKYNTATDTRGKYYVDFSIKPPEISGDANPAQPIVKSRLTYIKHRHKSSFFLPNPQNGSPLPTDEQDALILNLIEEYVENQKKLKHTDSLDSNVADISFYSNDDEEFEDSNEFEISETDDPLYHQTKRVSGKLKLPHKQNNIVHIDYDHNGMHKEVSADDTDSCFTEHELTAVTTEHNQNDELSEAMAIEHEMTMKNVQQNGYNYNKELQSKPTTNEKQEADYHEFMYRGDDIMSDEEDVIAVVNATSLGHDPRISISTQHELETETYTEINTNHHIEPEPQSLDRNQPGSEQKRETMIIKQEVITVPPLNPVEIEQKQQNITEIIKTSPPDAIVEVINQSEPKTTDEIMQIPEPIHSPQIEQESLMNKTEEKSKIKPKIDISSDTAVLNDNTNASPLSLSISATIQSKESDNIATETSKTFSIAEMNTTNSVAARISCFNQQNARVSMQKQLSITVNRTGSDKRTKRNGESDTNTNNLSPDVKKFRRKKKHRRPKRPKKAERVSIKMPHLQLIRWFNIDKAQVAKFSNPAFTNELQQQIAKWGILSMVKDKRYIKIKISRRIPFPQRQTHWNSTIDIVQNILGGISLTDHETVVND